MKAYFLEAPREIKVLEKEIPSIEKDQVLVKVSYVGLCGSDIHLYKGTYSGPYRYPMLFGHEWSGIVEKVGANVTKFKPGDKVTGDCSRYCNNCDICNKDKNLCDNIEKFGITIDGASAEYIVRKEMYIYKAPEDLELNLISLTEPISVSFHLLRKIAICQPDIKNKRILIYGGGPIGIAALLLLKNHYKCENIDLFDVIKGRNQRAKALGANIPSIENLNCTIDDTKYEEIYSMAKYDIILETTGVSKVFENSLNLLKPLGILGCLGMIPEATINQKLIVVKSLKVIGSIGGTGEFETVLGFLKENRIKARHLISHIISVNEIDKAFEISKDSSEIMKILIEL